MSTKEKFRKSYNVLKRQYRILQIEKANGITEILFFDKTGALVIARQGKMNAPLHTFEMYPYRFYWIKRIYWLAITVIRPKPNRLEKNKFLNKLVEYWWLLVIAVLAGIIIFMVEKGIIDIGI